MNIYDKIVQFDYENNMGLVNMTYEFFALYVKKLRDIKKRSILIVTPSLYEANKLNDSINNYVDAKVFQVDDVVNAFLKTSELKTERLGIINDLINNDNQVILTDLKGYLKKFSNPKEYNENIINIAKNDDLSRDNLILKLDDGGYERVSIVTKTGEYSVHGFVLDIFCINKENPIRLEFFGDTIESIREFDAGTQKSINDINDVIIYPNRDDMNNDSTIIDYMNDPIVVFKDYIQQKITYSNLVNEIDDISVFKSFDEIKYNDCLYYFDFDSSLEMKLSKILDFKVNKAPLFYEKIDSLSKALNDFINDDKTVIISLPNTDVNRFMEEVKVRALITDVNNIKDGCINIIKNSMSYGFIFNNYVFLTEYELFNKTSKVKKHKQRFKFATRIKDINKLEIGDYVVHASHGIGIYNGIKTLSKKGCLGDYLEVLYDKGDKLYIPASKIELISKYSGKDGYAPKINSLGSTSWLKTKQRVREKIRYEAERLIKVQALRSMNKGFKFSKDSTLQTEFESEFKYEETADQLRVTEEIKRDMESDTPMDRILCGDVGYGKTEVAFRACFKAIMDSKQVLYLCPTTLLSKQQYEAALERFKNYPVNIGILNRFTTPKNVEKILLDLKSGKLDFLIGTHRLLSDDVITHDLGLLVIDEEQRFGVAHKEKIKEMKNNIDVLTLTATPIPRTLQMAMVGIKNLSLIETPPKNRRSIQTYVLPYDKRVIRDAIYKELSRDGQIFVLYNNVSDIEVKKTEIEYLAPDAKVIIAHGQMNKSQLEERVNSFIEGKYNVLLCTTIIETGIDISNANSLIILNADRFGLSQLYQIRGRVGRGERQAYAYLMYDGNKVLNDIAVKRLSVIKDFTELGSGFAIATRDLSIRGAGDILGAEQAGFIDSVGIDLYMKMLNEEIMRLKGIEVEDSDDNNSQPLINVSTFVDDNYVSDEDLKIEIHKMINSINDKNDMLRVQDELEDRFGKLSDDLIIYMNEELFEKLSKKLGVREVIENNNYIELVVNSLVSQDINYEELFAKSIKISNKFIFSYKHNEFHIRLNKNALDCHPIFYLNKILEEI